MKDFTQKGRLISIKTKLEGEDDLLLISFKGSEHISDLFEFQLEVMSEKPDINPADIIGNPVTVTIHENPERQFYGFINNVTLSESTDLKLTNYKLKMVPSLWFLTQNNNYRIFQDQTTQQIITYILKETGFNEFNYKSTAASKPREYCVQYNESDFNFISRLLEEDGIAYYFEHKDGNHTLNIVDEVIHFKSITNPDISYSNKNKEKNQIRHWQHSYEFRKGNWSTNDYNIKQPTKSKWHTKATIGTVLNPEKPNEKTVFSNVNKYEHASYEPYHDFSGLEDLSLKRIETEEASINKVKAASNCSRFYAGGVFNLKNHTKKENGSYLITTVQHNAEENSYFNDSKKNPSNYTNEFKCIPSNVRYRPGLVHPKPVMSGPQSAVVIDRTDPLNMDRIKVLFHWTRGSNIKESQTCWIPVMQPWASNKWGTSFVPHIDMEVVVNFYNGDVDRPLIMGAVYNGENKSPYGNKNLSGILTSTTNEFRFDDTAGSEEIYIHGKKDLKIEVDNDLNIDVENNVTQNINNNFDFNITGYKNESIFGDVTINIQGKETKKTWDTSHDFNGGAKSTIYAGASSELFLGAKSSKHVGADFGCFIGAKLSTAFSIDKSIVKGRKYTYCDAKEMRKSKLVEIKAEEEYVLYAPVVEFNVDDSLTFFVGKAHVKINNDGTVAITGDVTIDGNLVVKGNITSNKKLKAQNFTSD